MLKEKYTLCMAVVQSGLKWVYQPGHFYHSGSLSGHNSTVCITNTTIPTGVAWGRVGSQTMFGR
jgi:hypothetical protein